MIADTKLTTCIQCKKNYIAYSMKHRKICRSCERKNTSKQAINYARSFKNKGFKPQNNCIDCKKPIHKKSTRCRPCSAKHNGRKTNK